MGRLISKLPLIVTGAPEIFMVNRQIGVGDSKYVVISDPLPQVTCHGACAIRFFSL